MRVKILLFLFSALLFIAVFGITACGSSFVEEDYEKYYENEEEYIEQCDSWHRVKAQESPDLFRLVPRITYRSGYFYFSSYMADGRGADFPAAYFWDEAYFAMPSYIYNPSLATMTLAFAMSAFGSTTDGVYDFTARNAVDLLSEIGFVDIETNHYFTIVPEEDTIGVVVAHTEIEVGDQFYTLIAVSTRGSGYGMEWAGNFTLGDGGYHEGFRRASEETYRFIDNYVRRHQDNFHENTMIWITGYSRGGAVANIVAAWVTRARGIAGIRLNRGNIFAYTFATPRAVPVEHARERIFTNIHNVLNPADIVTWVAPQIWGFGRYGVDRFLAERGQMGDAAVFDDVLRHLRAIDTGRGNETLLYQDGEIRHITDMFESVWFRGVNILPPGLNIEYSHNLMVPFLLELTGGITTVAEDQENYAAMLEDLVRALAVDAFSGEAFNDRLELAIYLFFSNITWRNTGQFVMAFVSDGMNGLVSLGARYLYESMREAGIYLDGGLTLAQAVLEAAFYIGFNGTLTLLHNLEAMAAAHHPEFMLAWMMSLDENFGGAPREFIPVYRSVQISGSVDVQVFDENDRLVARFGRNYVQDTGSHIVVTLLSDYMIVYLPVDMGYTLVVTTMARGFVEMSVHEFSLLLSDYSRVERMERVPLTAGNVITVAVPRFYHEDVRASIDGSNVIYTFQ
ncbi:MAG: hypothetical protein FWE11_09160 [Defluviitaleaceae bacterium]|nr:hypothetical protein [Defluviitaleaceae bacterium]